MTLWGAVLAVAVGLTLGVLGAGGSILTVPIFLYVLKVPVKPAIAMSLPVVAVAALAGFLLHRRKGVVNPRVALPFGISAVVGAFAGARIAPFIDERVQLILFAIAAATAGVLMWRRPSAAEPRAGSHPPRGSAVALLVFQGLGIGAVTGLIGVGGGFMIVPALVLLTGLPMTEAVATSLLVIALNAASGFLGYVGTVPLDWGLVAAFTAFTLVGIALGTRLSGRISAARLRRAFSVLVMLVAGYVVLRSVLGLGSLSA